LIEELGYSYLEMEKAGYCAPVYRAEVTYRKSVRYGDRVSVKAWVEENQGLKTVYGYQIVDNDNQIYAEGLTTHIIVRKDNFKPVQFKKVFPEWFQKYEEIKKNTACARALREGLL